MIECLGMALRLGVEVVVVVFLASKLSRLLLGQRAGLLSEILALKYIVLGAIK